MLGIKDAIKKIYSVDSLPKHLILFALTAIPAMLALPLNEISKTTELPTSTFWYGMLTLLVIFVISLYMMGYLYAVMHNSHDENAETIIPEFDWSFFRVFLKALPLMVVWFIYTILLIIITAIITLGINLIFPVLNSFGAYTIISIVGILFIAGVNFVFAQFTKEYDFKGLFNPLFAFKYLFKGFKDLVILFVKLIPILVVVGIVNVLGVGNDVLNYLFVAIGAYLTTIMQFIVNFCYVQIYKKI